MATQRVSTHRTNAIRHRHEASSMTRKLSTQLSTKLSQEPWPVVGATFAGVTGIALAMMMGVGEVA